MTPPRCVRSNATLRIQSISTFIGSSQATDEQSRSPVIRFGAQTKDVGPLPGFSVTKG
jgi:hypothetical protein